MASEILKAWDAAKSVNFDRSEQFTEIDENIKFAFPVCITWLRSSKVCSWAAQRLFGNLWKSKVSSANFNIRESRHPCCAPPDINSYDSFFRECKWNSCSLEWRLIQLEKLCAECSVNCQRSLPNTSSHGRWLNLPGDSCRFWAQKLRPYTISTRYCLENSNYLFVAVNFNLKRKSSSSTAKLDARSSNVAFNGIFDALFLFLSAASPSLCFWRLSVSFILVKNESLISFRLRFSLKQGKSWHGGWRWKTRRKTDRFPLKPPLCSASCTKWTRKMKKVNYQTDFVQHAR